MCFKVLVGEMKKLKETLADGIIVSWVQSSSSFD